MSFDGSLQEDLFGDQHVHRDKALESRDVMGPQGGAQEYQIAEDSPPELEPYSNDSASDKDGDEYARVVDEIVDATIRPSPMKMQTRSKSRMPNLPDPTMCSDTEDDEPHPR